MSPQRPPFLAASDYVFYLHRQIEKEKIDEFNENDRFRDSFINGGAMGFDVDLPKISELLRRLVDDLKYASSSFVDDFISESNRGVYVLLNLLRQTVNRQKCSTLSRMTESSDHRRAMRPSERQHILKRSMNDEYECLQCLKNAANRNPKTLQKILSHRAGLSILASCTVSSLTKSRLTALEILTKVCHEPDGARRVLEAMSTLRIIYGESVRFKFLVGMLNSGNNATVNGFEFNALAFLNALLDKIDNIAEKIRLQCELEEAGFDITYIEHKLKERGLPFDDPTWLEVNKFQESYINVDEALKENQLRLRESEQLKEEIKYLKNALNKLEKDKINFIQLERELKEKCEDLEQEVDYLKSKTPAPRCLSKPSKTKTVKRNGSDNGTGDSGQWTDSDDSKTDAAKAKSRKNQRQSPDDRSVVEEQTMRNEDELIYIPDIRPPANFVQYAETEEMINGTASKKSKSSSSSGKSNRSQDFRWQRRQRHSSENSELGKPTVVSVYPKPLSDNMSVADCENSELTLDWQYPSVVDFENENRAYNRPSSFTGFRRISNSMSFINDESQFAHHDEDIFSFPVATSEFLLKSRKNSQSFYIPKDKDNDFHSNNQQSNPLTNKTSKTLASALQSYFFSGTTSLRKLNKKLSKSAGISSEDSTKSFPIPKAYKNKFILKGHGNCGMYSGKSENNNLPDDVKITPDLFDFRANEKSSDRTRPWV